MADATEIDGLRAELDRLRSNAAATERRVRASHAVARVLAEETRVDAAAARILASLGSALDCARASWWTPSNDRLVLTAAWEQDGSGGDWEKALGTFRFKSGEGVPGRVWRDRGPVWIEDVESDANLPRAELLRAAQVKSAIGFPLQYGNDICGVIEIFTRTRQPPDDHLLEFLRTLGAQLGQFTQYANVQARLQREAEQRRRMAEASERLTSTLDVNAVLAELAAIAVPWLGDWTSIHLPEADESLRRLLTVHADGAKLARLLEYQTAHPPSARNGNGVQAAIRDRTTKYLPEVTDDVLRALAKDDAHLAKMRALEMRSWVVVPILTPREVIGALSVVSEGDRIIGEDEVGLIEELGKRAGIAVANARLYASAHAAARELDGERQTLAKLNEVGRMISAELDQNKLVQAVCDVATELTEAQMGAFLHNGGSPSASDYAEPFPLYAVSGVSRDAFAKLPPPRNSSLLSVTFNAKAVVRLGDVTKDPRYGKTPPHKGLPNGHPIVRSYLAVPIVARSGIVLGGLFFGHAKPDVFDDRAQRIAMSLAAHAATAIDNARLFSDQQRLIKELEKTNAELDQFAYAASHDLRAPLRGISNLASWIEEDLGQGAPKKVREHMAMLKGRAARMDKLINGLLELARVGRSRQKPERVDVTELLHDTIDLLSPPESMRILVVGAMPTLAAERFALQQVFLNLIGNAVQHGGRKDLVVRITATERADEVEFCVADNGVGIPLEHHERVWQIFQTLQARDIVESTGIGLTIVRKQVESNGGRAWIDSSVKDGASFRFTWSKRPK